MKRRYPFINFSPELMFLGTVVNIRYLLAHLVGNRNFGNLRAPLQIFRIGELRVIFFVLHLFWIEFEHRLARHVKVR